MQIQYITTDIINIQHKLQQIFPRPPGTIINLPFYAHGATSATRSRSASAAPTH